MSLTTNTIAHEGPRARGISVRGIGILVAGLALDDFTRLNTTSLNGLAPVASAAVASSVSVHPGFVEMHTTTFDGLTRMARAQTVDPAFLEMNIGSLEYPAGSYTEPWVVLANATLNSESEGGAPTGCSPFNARWHATLSDHTIRHRGHGTGS
jgi:hypothetical protein